MFLLGPRKNKFPLNCPVYGHFSNSIGFEQNIIMPMVSLSFKDKKGSASKAGGVIQITKNYPTLAAMTGDKKMLEINQRREGRVPNQH